MVQFYNGILNKLEIETDSVCYEGAEIAIVNVIY